MIESFGAVAGIVLKPAAALLLIPASLASGAVWGLYRAFVAYIFAMRFNISLKSTAGKGDREPARRSYFYWAGFAQYLLVVRDAFVSVFAAVREADEMRGDITFTKSELHEYFLWPLKLGGLFFVVSAVPAVVLFGIVVCLILAIIHGAVLSVLWLLYSLVLMIVSASDRLFLYNNKVWAQCPSCFKRIRLPAFECRGCSTRFHKQLRPNKYGILRHTCECGAKLGSTYGTGRYREAAFCPYCLTPLTSALSKPFTVHMVGGTESGKTVYLVSLYHQLKERVKTLDKTDLIIPNGYEERFTELDRWFKGRIRVPNTVDFTAQTYTLMVDHPSLDVKRQLIVYDIAGEAISGANAAVNMVSLTTCDGLFVMCDPFCSSELCERVTENGGQLPDHCSNDLTVLIDDLVRFLVDLRVIKTGERCSVPIAVMITKTDIPEVGEFLSESSIQAAFESSGGGEDIAAFTDKKCREFLESIGLESAVRKLDMQFTDIRFFPVSSMGHGYNDTPFAPSGVTEPFYWLLKEKDGDFLKIM